MTRSDEAGRPSTSGRCRCRPRCRPRAGHSGARDSHYLGEEPRVCPRPARWDAGRPSADHGVPQKPTRRTGTGRAGIWTHAAAMVPAFHPAGLGRAEKISQSEKKGEHAAGEAGRKPDHEVNGCIAPARFDRETGTHRHERHNVDHDREYSSGGSRLTTSRWADAGRPARPDESALHPSARTQLRGMCCGPPVCSRVHRFCSYAHPVPAVDRQRSTLRAGQSRTCSSRWTT